MSVCRHTVKFTPVFSLEQLEVLLRSAEAALAVLMKAFVEEDGDEVETYAVHAIRDDLALLQDLERQVDHYRWRVHLMKEAAERDAQAGQDQEGG